MPLNLLTITAFAVVWAMTFPIWTTLLLPLPIVLFLAFLGIDKYGGMQIVMFVAPACLLAEVGAVRSYRHAVESESDLSIGRLALEFVGTVVGGALFGALVFAAFFGLVICGDWLRKKLLIARQPHADPLVDATQQAGQPALNEESPPAE